MDDPLPSPLTDAQPTYRTAISDLSTEAAQPPPGGYVFSPHQKQLLFDALTTGDVRGVEAAFRSPPARSSINKPFFAIQGPAGSLDIGAAATALHVAASAGHARVVRWLLSHGADPRVRDGMHHTPLEVARGSSVKGALREALTGVVASHRPRGGENVDPAHTSTTLAKRVRRAFDEIDAVASESRRSSKEVVALWREVSHLRSKVDTLGGAGAALPDVALDVLPPAPGASPTRSLQGFLSPPRTLAEAARMLVNTEARVYALENVVGQLRTAVWVVAVVLCVLVVVAIVLAVV